MASNAGRIAITTGTYSDQCTTTNDLIANQAIYPEIREMLEYANRRALTTLLVSGVVTPYGINNNEKTKIPNVDTKGKGIGNNGYEFRVMGRIEKPSVILSQVGSTDALGNFTLKMADRHLNKGQVCVFNGGRFVANVMSQPRGNESSGYIYDFASPSGDLFVWATHVAGQAGTKTCFGAWTSFGERSLKGYGNSKFPDMFINHMTTQRSTVAITGDAAASVLWYNYTSASGKTSKGWMYEEVAQQQAKFTMENERQKWFGVSDMKNADGSIRATPRLTDPETGEYITSGDGWEEQVAGGNVAYGSGVNGNATLTDFTDMMKTLEKKSDMVSGLSWVCVTGTDGYANFQEQAVALAGNQNIQFMDQITQDGKPGGAAVQVGYNFTKLNINGNAIIVCKHPLFDDELLFTERGNDGEILMSSTYFIMNLGSEGAKNMEILHKAANGVNRSMVEAKLNGLTGASETTISEEDAMKFAILKQDMLVVYNTQICGIIYKSS
jgi:hypothetical protein